MSSQLVLVWLGTVALLSLFGGLVAAVPKYRENDGSLTGLIGFVFAFVFWLLFVVTSLNYFIVDGGETLTFSSIPLALAGLVGTITALLLLIDGGMRAMRGGLE